MMTTDRQIEAMARAIADAQYTAEWMQKYGDKYISHAKAAIDVLRTELCLALHEGGIKHPQQAEWDVMLEEIKALKQHARYVPMLVEALKYYADDDNYWHVTDGGKCYEATNADQGAKAQQALSQLPPELRGE